MRIALELTGEHPSLPRAEAVAVLSLCPTAGDPEGRSRILEVDVGPPVEPAIDRLADRLAMSYRILETTGEAEIDAAAITALAERVPLDGGTFAVRCSRLAEGLDPQLAVQIERSLGAALATRGKVDLEAPDTTVRVLLGETALVGVERAQIDRGSFEDRHVELRPFFSPISLHPRLARALVNLTRVQHGETIWDPFCGTGGLLLEASLVGARPIGSDLDPAMIEGTRETLEHYEQEARLEHGDVTGVAARLASVDAIVTDPPYGRASSTNKEPVGELYDRFLQAAGEILRPGGRLACMLPDPSEADRAPESLELVDQHAWYVHGSLTRHVLVFERG